MPVAFTNRRKWYGSATLNADTVVEIHGGHTATSTIFVTRITLSITTHANDKDVSFQDDAGSPIVIAKHTDFTAAAGVPSVVTWEFGEFGIPLTAGKDFDVVGESSGVAGVVYAEGWEVEA